MVYYVKIHFELKKKNLFASVDVVFLFVNQRAAAAVWRREPNGV